MSSAAKNLTDLGPDFAVPASEATFVKTHRPKDEYHEPGRKGFKPGNPGRPHGSFARFSLKAARAACAKIVEDPKYLAALHQAAIDRTISPQMEQTLWAYTYGKPKETIEVKDNRGVELQDMTDAELAERARLASERLMAARGAIARALPPAQPSAEDELQGAGVVEGEIIHAPRA